MARSQQEDNVDALEALHQRLGTGLRGIPSRDINTARKALDGHSTPLRDSVIAAYKTPYDSIADAIFHPKTGELIYIGIRKDTGETLAEVRRGFGPTNLDELKYATAGTVSDLQIPEGSDEPAFMLTCKDDGSNEKNRYIIWGPFQHQLPKDTVKVLMYKMRVYNVLWIQRGRDEGSYKINQIVWDLSDTGVVRTKEMPIETGKVTFLELMGNGPCRIECAEHTDPKNEMVRLVYKDFTSRWYDDIQTQSICVDANGDIQFVAMQEAKNEDEVNIWFYVNQDGRINGYDGHNFREVKGFACRDRIMLACALHTDEPKTYVIDAAASDKESFLRRVTNNLFNRKKLRPILHVFSIVISDRFVLILDAADETQRNNRYVTAWTIGSDDRLMDASNHSAHLSFEKAYWVHTMLPLCGDLLMLTPNDAYWFEHGECRFQLDCKPERLTEFTPDGDKSRRCVLGWRFDEGTIFISRYDPPRS